MIRTQTMVGRNSRRCLLWCGLAPWLSHSIQNCSVEICKCSIDCQTINKLAMLTSHQQRCTIDFLNRSFFQSVCVLGYCLTPVAIALLICKVILLAPHTTFLFFLRFATTSTGFLWATYGEIFMSTQSMNIFDNTNFYFLHSCYSRTHFPGRQSTSESKTACRLSNFSLLLYFVVARNIPYIAVIASAIQKLIAERNCCSNSIRK